MNLRAMLLQAAERNPEKIAIIENGNSLTYKELAEAATRLADSLVAMGIGHGDRVAMGMRNSTDFVVCFCATQMLGAAAAPFNFRLKAKTLTHILNNSGAKAIILDSSPDKSELEIVFKQFPDMPVISTEAGLYDNQLLLSDLINNGNLVIHNDIDRNDLSCIIYTSGTTGTPKGVPMTHRINYARLITFLLTTGPRFDDGGKTLGAAPLYHTVGLHWILMQTIFTNGTYYPVPKADKSAVDLIEQEGITFVFGSPTLIKQIIKVSTRPLEQVRYVCYGSAPTDQALLDSMFATFPNAQISEVYGTTEGSIPFVTSSMEGCKPGTLRTTGDFKVRLVAPASYDPEKQVGIGEFGELIFHTENAGVFERYWGDDGDIKAAEKIRSGWMFSGDIMTMDGNGNYFFCGRYDDTFVSGGENINPVEIENILNLHPGIDDVAVIGVPDPEWSNLITAFVIVNDSSLTADELDKFCRQSTLENFKRPRKYLFVSEMPRNPSGKLLRKKLLEMAV